MPEMDIRRLLKDEVEEAYLLEKSSYPTDEGASLETMKYRCSEAPDLFLGQFEDDRLIAYINATRYHGIQLTEESMKVHIPEGGSVCIHSVVVHPDKRRRGKALNLLRHFVSHVKNTQDNVHKILLISKAQHIPLYTKAGFTFVGPSVVKHGKSRWFEFEMDI